MKLSTQLPYGDDPSDLDRMQGSWQILSINRDGEPLPLVGPLANLMANVKRDYRSIQAGDTIQSLAHFRIDPSAQPPAIDVVATKGGAQGQTGNPDDDITELFWQLRLKLGSTSVLFTNSC